MRRTNFPTVSIGAFLAIGILSACLSAPPARAGIDQLWYVPWHEHTNGPNNANILSIRDAFCLDATDAGAENGTLVQVWPCNGQWNQRWRINPDDGAHVPDWCDSPINYHGTTYNPPNTCGTLWFSLAVGDKWYSMIDVPGSNDALGQHLQIYNFNGSPAQVWRTGNAAWGESPFWIRSNITGSGINRCWTNRDGWPRIVRLWDCAYDF
jgi:hypothetical protein